MSLEQSFPRGGKHKQRSESKRLKKDESANLFQTSVQWKRTKSKNETTETVDEENTDANTKDDLQVDTVDLLTTQMLSESMKILGVIAEIKEHQLTMSLPGCLVGYVPFANISSPYSNLLKKYVDNNLGESELLPLSALFSVGSKFACQVKSIIPQIKNPKKTNVVLSINPEDVNSSLVASSLKNGMTIQAAVVSNEDYGYVMDVGIKNVHGFLKNQDAEDYILHKNNGQPLGIGKVLTCVIAVPPSKAAGGSNVIGLSADPKKVANAIMGKDLKLNLNTIVPGMHVPLTVSKVLTSGLVVNIWKYKGVVHKLHFVKPSHTPKDYDINNEHIGCVLYVHPLLHLIYVSLQPHLRYAFPKDLFPGMSIGGKLKGRVKNRDPLGVIFQIDDTYRALCKRHQLQDGKVKQTFLNLLKERTKEFGMRILAFNHLDNIINVSLRKSIMNISTLTCADLKIGEIVKCKVTRFLTSGAVEVQVSYTVKGIIPPLHTADYPLKVPSKSLKIGQDLECKVWNINNERNLVTLTNKKTLISSEHPFMTSLKNVKSGSEVEGVVVHVKSNMLLVAFPGDISGFVVEKELQAASINRPEKAFYRGQIISGHVLGSNLKKNTLNISLVQNRAVAPGSDIIPSDKYGKMEIGKIYNCIVRRKVQNGLFVELLPSNIEAFLPTYLLSDLVHHCDLLYDSYREGHLINNVLGFANKRMNYVTKKSSFVNYARSFSLPLKWDDVEENRTIPCIVFKHIENRGYLLKTFNDLTGRTAMQNSFSQEVLPIGFTIIAKIKKRTKKKVLLTTTLSSCWNNDPVPSLDILLSYLEENKRISEEKKMSSHNRDFFSVEVGSIVSFHISHVTSLGVAGRLVDMPFLKAVATKEHIAGINCERGETISALVVYVDIENDSVELSLNANAISAVAKSKEKSKLPKLTENQIVKAEVLDVKDYYALVNLKGSFSGNLFYLPCKRHWNDFIGRKSLYTIGNVYKITIKKISPNLAILAAHDKSLSSNSELSCKQLEKEIYLGDICNATIVKVLPLQLDINLEVEPLEHGRVFITEILDSIEDGINPLTNFQQGQKIRVRILHKKTLKNSRHFYECSLKPSALQDDFKMITDKQRREQHMPGCTVICFVEKFVSNCLIVKLTPHISGKVYFLNVSINPKVVKSVSEFFSIGQGFNALVVSSNDSHVELSFTGMHELSVGSIVNGQVLSCQYGLGILLRLPFGYRGTVALTELTDEYDNGIRILNDMTQYTIIRCYVLSLNHLTKEAALSLRKSRFNPLLKNKVQDPEVKTVKIGDVLRGFVKLVGNANKPANIILGDNLHGHLYLNDNQRSQMSKGHVVTVIVDKVEDNNITLKLQMPIKCNDNLKMDNILEAVDPSDGEREELLNSQVGPNIVKKELKKDQTPARKRNDSTSSDQSPKKIMGSAILSPKRSKSTVIMNDSTKFEDSSDPQVECLQVESESVISQPERFSNDGKSNVVIEDADKNSKFISKRDEQVSSVSPKKKTKKSAICEQLSDNKETEISSSYKLTINRKSNHSVKPSVPTKLISSKRRDMDSQRLHEDSTLFTKCMEDVPCLEVPDSFSWETTPAPKKRALEKSAADDSSSSGSDDEEENDPKQNARESKKKKKKYDSALTEEEHRYQKERLLADDDRQPQTVDDYDRLVLASPNSSIIWIKYMTFHLQDAEVDKARAVAERALKTICFREEQEKLNVWRGLLNLENLYGSEDTLNAVLQRALQANDPLKVYNQMIMMYTNTNKIEQAEKTYNTMLKRYKADKNVWINFMKFYMHDGRFESARKLLERALKSLPTKEHIEVVSCFAKLEFKFGDVERGKTLFDNLFNHFPSRTKDLWSVYVDLTAKHCDVDTARNILDRALSADLSVKKMQSMFKKALEFESKFGSEEDVERVKQRARDYVEGHT